MGDEEDLVRLTELGESSADRLIEDEEAATELD